MNFNRAIKITQLMTTDLITLGPNDNLVKVEEIFDNNNFHHIPIVNEAGVILGIISKTDFYKVKDSFTIFNTKKSRDNNAHLLHSVLTQEVMTKQLATLHPEDTALMAMGLFKENLFHAIPIVDSDKKLLGLLSIYDLLTYAYNEPLYMAEIES